MRPELHRNQLAVSSSLASRFERAIDIGIPLHELVGVDDLFENAIAASGEIKFIAVVDRRGCLLSQAGIDRSAVEAVVAGFSRAMRSGPAPGADCSGAATDADEQPQVETVPAGTRSGESLHIASYFVSIAPIVHGDTTIGWIYSGIDDSYFNTILRDVRIDIAIILGVALLISIELVMLLIRDGLINPMRLIDQLIANMAARRYTHISSDSADPRLRALAESLNELVLNVDRQYRAVLAEAERLAATGSATVREAVAAKVAGLRRRATFSEGAALQKLTDARLARARFLAFLFTFAEEMTRPFLPLYVKGVAAETIVDPSQFLTGLPITVFMLTSAIGNPIGAALADRLGRHASFALGAGLSTIGLIGTALPLTYYDLLLWRGLSGLGYAFCLAACQGYVIDRTDTHDRAKGVALFVGGIISSAICGPAIGGVLADRIGNTPTLVIAAMISTLAGIVAWRLIREGASRGARAATASFAAVSRALFSNARFVALALLAAIPAKALLTGYLFYLLPLVLAQDGAHEAEIGRIAMTYGLIIVAVAPIAAWIADRWQAHAVLVIAGGFVAAAALVASLAMDGRTALLVATVGFGMGQAMSMASQLTLVTQVCRNEIGRYGHQMVLGMFRLVERAGNAIGPMVAAYMVIAVGLPYSVPLLGAAAVIAIVVFGGLWLVLAPRSETGHRELEVRSRRIPQ